MEEELKKKIQALNDARIRLNIARQEVIQWEQLILDIEKDRDLLKEDSYN